MPPMTRLPSPSKQKPGEPASNDGDDASARSKVLQRDTPTLLARKPSTRLQPRSTRKAFNAADSTPPRAGIGIDTARDTRDHVASVNRVQQATLRVPSSKTQGTQGLISTKPDASQPTIPAMINLKEAPSVVPDNPGRVIVATEAEGKALRPVSQVPKPSKLSGPVRPLSIISKITQLRSGSAMPVPQTARRPISSTPQPLRSASTATTTTRPISSSPRKPQLTTSRVNSTPIPSARLPQMPRLAPSTGMRALSSPLKPSQSSPSSRPQFTTHQRSFSPSKPTSKPPPRALSPNTLRAQTHLLHLSILHKAATPTFAAYTASAHAQLHSLHDTLQTLYAKVLLLERKARQAENVLALHGWAGGNVKSVGRRLNVLCSVLKEVMALSAPGGGKVTKHRQTRFPDKPTASTESKTRSKDNDDEEEEMEEEVDEQQGPYAHLIEAFTHWTNWVSEIWRFRERQDCLPTPSPLSTAYPNSPTPIGLTTSNAITPIDPLGDALKSSLRSLTITLHALSLKLAELPPFPTTPKETTTSTPAHLLRLTRELVSQMQEELQLIREIEFEVVIGEEAWMKQRLSTLSNAVDDGFLTPMRGQ